MNDKAVHERIVVGMDGSASSIEALRWAGTVAQATGTDILAVSAFVNPYSEVTPRHHDELVAHRRAELGDVWIPAALGERTIDSEVLDGDPRDVLQRVVRPDDLLVVGRTGEGGEPGLFHVGSVAEHAAHHVAAALAVIPSTRRPDIGRIAVGVDGSPASSRAIDWLIGLAAPIGAEVIAVHVDDPRVVHAPNTNTIDVGDRLALVESWIAPLADAGVDVSPIIQHHLHPADGVLGVASAHDCDLLVVGMRGLGGFTGLRVGGTAIRILHRAAMPLVLVPVPA